jgi:hypothetical protein
MDLIGINREVGFMLLIGGKREFGFGLFRGTVFRRIFSVGILLLMDGERYLLPCPRGSPSRVGKCFSGGILMVAHGGFTQHRM